MTQNVKTVYQTDLNLPVVGRGKVRDMYAVGTETGEIYCT